MEIWLVLTVAGMVSSSPIVITVNEEAKTKLISEGSTVVLHCSLITDCQRCRLSWYFNPNGHCQTDHTELNNTMLKRSNIGKNEILGTYNLYSVSYNDSGWYCCRAWTEIPQYSVNSSNWTRLVVDKSIMENRENTSQIVITQQEPGKPASGWSDWWMWITLGALGLVLMILLIIGFVLRRRQLRLKALDCPIYTNMAPGKSSRQPSPQPRSMDNRTINLDSKNYQNMPTPNQPKRYERRMHR